MGRWLWILALAATPWIAAGGDRLILSGSLDSLAPGRDGGSGGAEWLHTFTSGAMTGIGGYHFRLGESRWSYAKVEGVFRPANRLVLHGEANVGGGEDERGGFGYQIYKASANWALLPKRLYGEIGGQFIRVAASHGTLIDLGATWAPLPPLQIRADYFRVIGGNLRTNYLAGRVDYYHGRWDLLCGVSRGQTRSEFLNLVGGRGNSSEYFAGFGVKVHAHKLTLVYDRLKTGPVIRSSWLFAWQIGF